MFPVLLAVFAGVLLSTLLAYFSTRRTVEDLALGQAVQTLGFLDREVTARAREMAFLLDLWSREDVFRLSLEDTYLGLSARAAADRRLLGRVGRGYFSRIFLLNGSGAVVAASEPGMVQALNMADRSYFQRAMAGLATQETFASGRFTGQPVLVAAAPVLGPDKVVLGVLAVSLDIGEFSREILDGVRLGQSGGAYILDSQGGMLGLPSWAGEGQFAPGARAVEIFAAEGQDHIVRYRVRGVERLAQARRNTATGWYLVVEADHAEILRPASRLAGLSGAVSLGTLLLVALALAALRRAMVSLSRSEASFRTIFESAPYAITLSRQGDGAYLDVNRAFLEGQGLTREQVLGKTPVELNILREEEVEAIRELLARDGRLRNAEATVRRKDGSLRHVIYSADLVPLGNQTSVLSMTVDVTEKKEAAMSAFRWRQKFEVIASAARHVFYDHDLVRDTVAWSGSTREVLGFDGDQLQGGMEKWPDMLHAEDRDRVMASLGEARSRCARFDAEYRLRRRDGAFIHVQEKGVFIPGDDGSAVQMLGVIQDVTAHKQAESDLRQSEEKFSQLFRLSPDVSVLVNLRTGRLADVNEAYVQVFGYTREEALGRTTLELNVYADPSRREQLYELLGRDGHVENFEIEALRKDGSSFTVLLSCQTLAIDGEPHMLGVFRDITETRRMQEMMIQTEKMISVGGIAAGIAHEINNPLGIVLQAAQNLVQRTRTDFPRNREVARELGLDLDLLEKYMKERKLDVFLVDIRDAAVRASEIIRHMLDFSRRSESKRKVCDIPGIVDKALALAGSDYDLKKNYDFKQIKIVKEIDEDLPVINCTETEIEQVLLNLFRNAAQAMAQADPPVAEPRIAVRVAGLPDRVRIEIEDNGPGMSAAVQRRIFEPFFTTKPPGEGTGLGLSVSYFIVTTGHGGRMTVHSDSGAGTRFRLELPVDEAWGTDHGA
jgi:PAS domain S-box-containing protein